MNSITLVRNTPLLVTPSGESVVQNTMPNGSYELLVSSHGDTTKPWIQIAEGDTVRISEPTYFMQNGWETFVFPIMEGL